jgi:hypothetical protein
MAEYVMTMMMIMMTAIFVCSSCRKLSIDINIKISNSLLVQLMHTNSIRLLNY